MFLIFATTFDTALGGIARSVPRLAKALADCGESVILIGPRSQSMTFREAAFDNVDLRLADTPNELKRLLKDAIQSLPKNGSVVYHAGVWSPWNHRCAVYARRAGIPYIASPRSSLDPWALQHRGLKKKLAWWLYAKKDLNAAAGIHATADIEADNIRHAGVKAPVFVVPHGVDLLPAGFDTNRSNRELHRLLFLSRLHPKKGLEDLIQAFAALNPLDWELVIAGNDADGYSKKLQSLAATSRAHGRIHFHGPVSDNDKWALYASSDAFVLPSYSENFGLVVAEALACGVPVVTTTATPWHDLTANGCGWCIPTGTENLQNTLYQVCALDREQLQAMGHKGRLWIQEEFSWEKQAKRFLNSTTVETALPFDDGSQWNILRIPRDK